MKPEEELEIILEFAEDKPNSLVRPNKTFLSYTDNQKKKFSYTSNEHINELKKKLIKGRKKTFKEPIKIWFSFNKDNLSSSGNPN